MTDQFLKFLTFIFQWECVYKKGHYGDLSYVTFEDVDGDPGGVTKWGIDKRAHPKLDVKNLNQKQATEVYWEEWVKAGCDKMEPGLAEAYFNCCVNCGNGRAKKIISTGVTTAKEFIDRQDLFYRSLVSSKPSFQKFLKGWLNRTVDLRKFLKSG